MKLNKELEKQKAEAIKRVEAANTKRCENYEVCKKCGGSCCKGVGCALVPQDLPKESLKDINTIRELLMTGKYSLDYYTVFTGVNKNNYQGELYFIRMRNKYAPVSDYNYRGGDCVALTKNGCRYSYKNRPTQGKLLEPVDDGICVSHLEKLDVALCWSEYNTILAELWEEFSMDNTKAIPQKELSKMVIANDKVENIESDTTEINLWVPIDRYSKNLDTYLEIKFGDGRVTMCVIDDNAWRQQSTGCYSMHEHTKHKLYAANASTNPVKTIQHWKMLGYLPDEMYPARGNSEPIACLSKLIGDVCDVFTRTSAYLTPHMIFRKGMIDSQTLSLISASDESKKVIDEYAADMRAKGYNPTVIANYRIIMSSCLTLIPQLESSGDNMTDEDRLTLRMLKNSLYWLSRRSDFMPFI